MTRFRSALMGTALAAGLALGLGGEAKAAPIITEFRITTIAVTLGSGFANNGTVNNSLINLTYTANPAAPPYTYFLAEAGETTSQGIGNFTLREECGATNSSTNAQCLTGATITATENTAANRTLSVAITFSLPIVTTLTFNAAVTSVEGAIVDGGTTDPADLTFSFTGQSRNFGDDNLAEFTVNIADMVFNTCDSVIGSGTGRRCNASKAPAITITLVTPETPIPEPAALAVLGMGLLGLAAVGRRRRIV